MGYYVYGVDGTRHSKAPLSLEMAKKQMTALNIAHAKKMGKVIKTPNKPKHAKGVKHHSNPVHHSKVVEKAVEFASMAGKSGMHSPAGVLSTLVSETTGGGSGLANDAHWVSAVKSGGRKTIHMEPMEHKTTMPRKEPMAEESIEGHKMTATEKHKKMIMYYNEGKSVSEVPADCRLAYGRFYKAMKNDKPPAWYKKMVK